MYDTKNDIAMQQFELDREKEKTDIDEFDDVEYEDDGEEKFSFKN